MMRIKVLVNLGTNDFPESPFREGEEHEVTDLLGKRLVTLKFAEDITPEPAVEPAKPAVQEAQVSEKPKDKFQQMRGK